jgi:hypothetical protein
VTTAIRRPVAILLAFLAAAAVLTGCSGKPNQAGAAAIVGDTVIPLEQVQNRVQAMLADDSAARRVQGERKLDVQAREVLTLQVQHLLIGKVAREQGLSVPDSQVRQLIDRVGGVDQAARNSKDALGISVFDKRSITERVRDELLLAELARRQLGKVEVTFDYVVASSRPQADDYATKLAANPGQAESIIKGATGQAAGEMDKKVAAAHSIQDAARTPLFGLPPNTVATFPAGPNGTQWLTVLVRKRDTNANPGKDAQDALGEVEQQTLSQAGQQLLISYGQRIGIQISPRYGVWDPIGQQVVPSEGEAVGVVLPVHRQTSPQ